MHWKGCKGCIDHWDIFCSHRMHWTLQIIMFMKHTPNVSIYKWHIAIRETYVCKEHVRYWDAFVPEGCIKRFGCFCSLSTHHISKTLMYVKDMLDINALGCYDHVVSWWWKTLAWVACEWVGEMKFLQHISPSSIKIVW